MTETSSKPLPAGTPGPAFTLPSGPDSALRLSDLGGRPMVLVFYPADWSPVCGDELALYNELLHEFRRHEAEVVGISSPRALSPALTVPTGQRTASPSGRCLCSTEPA